MAEPRDLEYLGEFELDEETARRANAMIEQAERDIAGLAGEVRVHLRWNREQIEIVKRAAARRGVPYQTYLKQAVMRQALTDLNGAAAASTS